MIDTAPGSDWAEDLSEDTLPSTEGAYANFQADDLSDARDSLQSAIDELEEALDEGLDPATAAEIEAQLTWLLANI